jgi:hypothetical protein
MALSYFLRAQDQGCLPSVTYVEWISSTPTIGSYGGSLPCGGPLINLSVLAVIDSGSGGGGSSPVYIQDCSAGGTVSYTGPTSPVPAIIFLTGSPAADFSFVFPNAQYNVGMANFTAKIASLGGTANPGTWTLLSNGSATFVSTIAGTHALATSGVNEYGETNGDLLLGPGADGPVWSAGGLGAANVNTPGTFTSYPIRGAYMGWDDFDLGQAMQPIGFTNWGSMGVGPGPSPTAEPQMVQWYSARGGVPIFDAGFIALDTNTGSFGTVLAAAYYPGTSWTTQAQGCLVARSGDEITGTSQSISHFFPLVITTAPLIVYKCTIEMVAKPNAVGSGTMTSTDFSSAEIKVTVATLSSTAAECVSVTTVTDPSAGSSTNLTDMTVVVGVSGNDLVVTVTSSANAGPSDTTDFQLKVTAEIG